VGRVETPGTLPELRVGDRILAGNRSYPRLETIDDLSHQAECAGSTQQAAQLPVMETREERAEAEHVHISGGGNNRGWKRGCDIRTACVTVADRRLRHGIP